MTEKRDLVDAYENFRFVLANLQGLFFPSNEENKFLNLFNNFNTFMSDSAELLKEAQEAGEKEFVSDIRNDMAKTSEEVFDIFKEFFFHVLLVPSK